MTSYAIAQPSRTSSFSRKRKTDSLMQGKLNDGMCHIEINDKAKFTFHYKGKIIKGEVGLVGCDTSMSAQPLGSIKTGFYLKLYLNEFENAFPKIEVGSLFHDWDITMDVFGNKGHAEISTIDICQDMDIIQEIGGGIHNLGGTRYIEINGEIT